MNEELTAQQKLDIIVRCIDHGAPALKDDLLGYLNSILNLANTYLANQVTPSAENQQRD